MRCIISAIILLHLNALCYSQTQYLRKFNDFTRGAVAYLKDQAYIAYSKDNSILIYPTSSEALSVELIEPNQNDIHSIFLGPTGTEIISVSEKEVNTWEYLKRTKISSWKLKQRIIGGAIIDSKRIALISESELIVFDFVLGETVYSSKEHRKFIRSVAVSSNGQLIATGGGDNNVIIQDAGSGKTIRQLSAHKNVIRAIDISPDGLLIASGDDSGVVLVHDISGNLRFTFSEIKGWVRSIKFSHDNKHLAIGADNGDILVYSLDNGLLADRYDTGTSPVTSMAFSPDGKELSFGAQLSAVKSIDITRLGISSIFHVRDKKDLSAPQIYISNPPNIQEDKVRVYKDIVDIKGTVMDESGVRNLKVNGIDVPLKDNNNFVIYLPLSVGDNPVLIESRDVNDNISVKRFTIQRRNLSGEEYDVTKARNFLFVIGINDYEHWPKLNNAVKDANDIANSLITQYNFEFDNITLLKNEQATRSNIYKSMRSLIEQVTPQDNLLIYFSGHGYFDALLNEGYWIPADAKVNNSGDYLSNSDILKIIGNIDSQHTFLIADACFSGSLFSESKRGYAENVEKYKSRWGLASGRLEVVSDGEAGRNSPFALATINFLNENKKDKVAISELIQYVKMKVAETSDQTPLGNPLKVLGDEGGEMVLYKKQD